VSEAQDSRKDKPDRDKRAAGKRKSTDGYDLADAAPDGLGGSSTQAIKRGRSSPSSDDYDVDKLDGANGHSLVMSDSTTAAPGVVGGDELLALNPGPQPQPQPPPPRQSAAAASSADYLKKRELDLLAARLAVEEKRLALETARLELDRRNHDATVEILMQLQENSSKILLALVGRPPGEELAGNCK
ncbi:hypothetical protein HK405_002199, partial [Cladochytrium tenue]